MRRYNIINDGVLQALRRRAHEILVSSLSFKLWIDTMLIIRLIFVFLQRSYLIDVNIWDIRKGIFM